LMASVAPALERGSQIYFGIHADHRGRPVNPLKIDTGLFVDINGVEQWITIRGSDLKNPVVLMLPGPGAGFSRMAAFFSPWERDFTLVQWDQPGAGATAAKQGAAAGGPLNYERIISDGIAVVEWVRHRLAVPTIALLGFSGGTIVGLKMVRQRPELFFAYVGAGQIVNWAQQDILSYRLILERARSAVDAAAIAELETIGAPPYSSASQDAIKSKYAGAPTPAEQRALALLDPVMAAMNTPPPDATYVPKGLTLGDTRTLAMAAYAALRGELAVFDARALGVKHFVPMLFLQGELDVFTVTSEVRAYADEIEAPRKVFALIEGAGHSAFLMRDEFLASLNRYLRPIVG
jgi:proline iminopeptidase